MAEQDGIGDPRKTREDRERVPPDYREVQTAETFSANGSATLGDHR
jgi:hypothetical protein